MDLNDTIPIPADLDLEAGPQFVLVADDEHLIATDVADNLTALGFDVIGPAANGAQAIELAKRNRPDLAILDIRMPEVDGLAAAGVLFCQMGIPVLIISAYSDAEYLETATRIGVFGYVLKPVTRELLRVNVAMAWSRYKQHTRLRQKVWDLQVTLEERKLIEQAKGILMEKMGLTESQALAELRRRARSARRKMADLARAILETKEIFTDS